MLLMALLACGTHSTTQYITTRDGQFYRGDAPYNYVGANFWYGAILGSEGQGGDRQRLARELDTMDSLGINNVRVLVGGIGDDTEASHIAPSLMKRDGEYNDTLLRGLDYLMCELEKRNMTAVLYLNNAWEWSGGFGALLNMAGEGTVPTTADWNEYQRYHSRFTLCDSAMAISARHTRYIVSRTNTVTGKPYAECPALMAWELCNEPRPFSLDDSVHQAFVRWIESEARLIKSIDPNHLVTTGSEGKFGCDGDMDLLRAIHDIPQIDYACIHIWPHNWTWLGPCIGRTSEAIERNGASAPVDSVQNAIRQTKAYIEECYQCLHPLGKPIVLEEFGYPRDGYQIAAGSPTHGRDTYYEYVLQQVGHGGPLAGCNFWSWGGHARVQHAIWQRWDPYTGDPAQEEQGLNSIFASDSSTLSVIHKHTSRLRDGK